MTRRCSSCRETAVYRDNIHYKSAIKHEGKLYEIDIPELSVPRCCKCDEIVFDNKADEQIQLALRKQLSHARSDGESK